MLNLDINYKYYFSSDDKNTILMLHGWGCKGDIFKQYVDNLQDKYNILVVDLYGFGQSIDPKPFLIPMSMQYRYICCYIDWG